MKKIRPIKRTWYDWLINYIPKPIRKNVGGFKDKIISLFKTGTPKGTVYGRGKKISKPRKQNMKKLFISEENREKSKDRIIRDIRTFLEQEKEEDYKSKRVSSFWNKNYIEYEDNGDKNSNLQLNEYLNKVKPYLRYTIIDLKSSNIWKIQLTIEINFIFSKDTEEERVICSMSNNIKFTSYNDANEVNNKLFE